MLSIFTLRFLAGKPGKLPDRSVPQFPEYILCMVVMRINEQGFFGTNNSAWPIASIAQVFLWSRIEFL